MTIDENWGVSIDRARAFFAQMPDVTPVPDGFECGGCSITLTPQSGQMGTIPLQRTQLHIDGPEAEVREIYHRFFIRFLSAGG